MRTSTIMPSRDSLNRADPSYTKSDIPLAECHIPTTTGCIGYTVFFHSYKELPPGDAYRFFRAERGRGDGGGRLVSL